jgi:hypothetical protein
LAARDRCSSFLSVAGPDIELSGGTILRVFLKNGTQPALVEPQFKPVLFCKPFDFGFPILQL